MDELKLCPFCGRKAEKGEDRESYECVMCKDCTATVYSMDEDTDVELWNTRPIEDELRKRIEDLELGMLEILASTSIDEAQQIYEHYLAKE